MLTMLPPVTTTKHKLPTKMLEMLRQPARWRAQYARYGVASRRMIRSVNLAVNRGIARRGLISTSAHGHEDVAKIREWSRAPCNVFDRPQRLHVRAYSTMSGMDLNAYVDQVSSALDDDELLKELRERTQREWPKAEQLIDEPQSKALSFLVQLTGSKDVLEVGCFTGYSAISLANGLARDGGRVTTCDVNADTMAFARTFFDRSTKRDQIDSIVSDGMEFLETCAAQGRQFDLIFVDANKRQYIHYFNTILERKLLRPQGLLVFDNTLFRGRVLASANGEANKKERIAHGLAEFNEAIRRDTRTLCVLLPLWDGLTLVRQRY